MICAVLGFWGVRQSFKRGYTGKPSAPWLKHFSQQDGAACFPSPPALPRCIKSCPPPYPVFPPRRFPEAQERVQHPDLNFNAILAPKASFCCCESSSGKCLCSSPAGSGSPLRLSFRQVQPSPACSPSCPSKGRKPLL